MKNKWKKPSAPSSNSKSEGLVTNKSTYQIDETIHISGVAQNLPQVSKINITIEGSPRGQVSANLLDSGEFIASTSIPIPGPEFRIVAYGVDENGGMVELGSTVVGVTIY
jgi:hypothetical protein